MHLLAIEWASVGVKAGQLLLALSILVILHEFGHFITAKWFGCRVEKFYLFFDPWFSLLKKKVGETEYGIGWLPLGGYVKISGMIDESMDKEAMKEAPKDWEFRSKPAWQRLIIMLGGIIMNVLVAIAIYAFILMMWGDKKVPTSSMKYGVFVGDSTLMKIGLKTGDRLLGVDNKPVYDLTKFKKKLITAKSIQIERDGHSQDIVLPIDLLGQLSERKNQKRQGFIEARRPAMVAEVNDTSNAFKAGLRKNDMIIGIDSVRCQFHDELKMQLESQKNKTILLTVKRNNQEISFMTPINSKGEIGFTQYGTTYEQMDSLGWLKLEVTKYGFFAAFPAAVKMTWEELGAYIEQFKFILDRKTGAYKGIGGFKAIANAFPGVWDWESFWSMTAFLSIVLAFMNLLPIPALDGGHVMFTLYELITRRKANEKFLEYAQVTGMILLLLLMVYANANDWLGWGK